jgi:hypothetical protein
MLIKAQVAILVCTNCSPYTLRLYDANQFVQLKNNWTVPQLMRLVAGFPPRWPEFDLRLCHVGFLVDKVALGQVPS